MNRHERIAVALLTRVGIIRPRSWVCPRCNVTRLAMDYVRHQWIAAGIDR